MVETQFSFANEHILLHKTDRCFISDPTASNKAFTFYITLLYFIKFHDARRSLI